MCRRFSLSSGATERWPSGRRRSPAKGVEVKSFSWVRIPSSPPSCFALRASQDKPRPLLEAGCPPRPRRRRAQVPQNPCKTGWLSSCQEPGYPSFGEGGRFRVVGVSSGERGCGRRAVRRHNVGPETAACRAQCRKIQPYVQVPAMANRDLHGLLEPGQSGFIRALSQIRLWARFRRQTAVVTAARPHQISHFFDITQQ